MNNDADTPDWELLPRDPEGFFGLEPGYDLRTLKRSYNKLLRKYKPEKFPDEFQKIRQAFEHLNDFLRYGQANQDQGRNTWSSLTGNQTFFETSFDTPTQSSQVDEHQDKQPSQDDDQSDKAESNQRALEENESQQSGSESADTNTRLDSARPSSPTSEHETQSNQSLSDTETRPESPVMMYDRLSHKTDKTAYDYFTLATLSDVIQNEGPDFADWLLKGIKEHPSASQLSDLLREYFANYVSIGEAPQRLLQTASILTTDRFYYLTERLWDRLLQKVSFNRFVETLQACEQKLLDHRIDSRMVFYLHLLKRAMFVGDDDWLSDNLAFLEENFERMPRWAEEEQDTLERLHYYRVQRENFRSRGGARERVDEAIVAWCEAESEEADRIIIECHYSIANAGTRWLEETAYDDDDLKEVLFLWERIADDVLERVGVPENEADQQTVDKTVANVLYSLESQHDKTSRNKRGVFISYVALAVFVVGLWAALVRIAVFFRSMIWEAAFFRGLLNFAESLGLFILTIITAIALYIAASRMQSLPAENARNALIRLLQMTSMPVDELADLIESFHHQKFNDCVLSCADDVAHKLRQDAALQWYSISQRFVQ